jgi:hypothetical protein
MVPELAEAPNDTVPEPQRELGVVPVMEGEAFTDIFALLPEAVILSQPRVRLLMVMVVDPVFAKASVVKVPCPLLIVRLAVFPEDAFGALTL